MLHIYKDLNSTIRVLYLNQPYNLTYVNTSEIYAIVQSILQRLLQYCRMLENIPEGSMNW